MALTTDHLQAIDRHLRKDNWLLNEGLITELTDHYIAGIDDQMSRGTTFETALAAVHTDFGGRKGLLALEEDYQVQQARRIGRQEWRTIRSFVEGSRWPITLAIFGLLYGLNTYWGHAALLSNATYFGQWFVGSSVLGNLVMSLRYVYMSRREGLVAVLHPTSVVYSTLYCLSLTLVLLNRYALSPRGLSLSATALTGLDTLLETLCIIYCVAVCLTLKYTLTRPDGNSLKKA